MVPGDIMLLSMHDPERLDGAQRGAREAAGSIANFYAASATCTEFLFGKQRPYLTVALSELASLTATAEQVDRYLRAKGYAPRMINGKQYYCRGEDVLGTPLQHAQHGVPADQLNAQERTSQEGVTRKHSSFASPSEGGKP